MDPGRRLRSGRSLRNNQQDVWDIERIVSHLWSSSDNGDIEVIILFQASINMNTYVNKLQYKLRWKGFTKSDDTWEWENMVKAPFMIQAYWEKVQMS
jgi:hypothetical protein